MSCSCHVILIEVGEVGKTEFLFRFGLGGLLCGSYFSLFIIKHIKFLEEKFAGSMGKGKKEPSTAVMDVVLQFYIVCTGCGLVGRGRECVPIFYETTSYFVSLFFTFKRFPFYRYSFSSLKN